MIGRLVSLVLFLVILGGCEAPFIDPVPRAIHPLTTAPMNCSEITSVVQEFSVEFLHAHHLYLDKAKTYCEGGITTVQLEYHSQNIIDVCEARKLIVDVVEDFLALVNQNPALGQQLASFPFTSANLEIYITLESYFGRYIDPYYVHWISLEDDVVTFYAWDLRDNTKGSWHARREAYATAREIVVYQRQAEEKYREAHDIGSIIFGNQRYFPPK